MSNCVMNVQNDELCDNIFKRIDVIEAEHRVGSVRRAQMNLIW
jgi:hypothetical protein